MNIKRASGLLLHITSLPGKYGCGTLGREAAAFSDFLAASGQSYWQVLPLGPVCAHWNFSPYSSPSAFAGNELLIDPEKMHSRDWLTAAELQASEDGRENDFADLAKTASQKTTLLAKAASLFTGQQNPGEKIAFERFCSEQRQWLDDYCPVPGPGRSFQHLAVDNLAGRHRPPPAGRLGLLAAKIGRADLFLAIRAVCFFQTMAGTERLCQPAGFANHRRYPFLCQF